MKHHLLDYRKKMGKLNILYQSDDAYAAYLGISLFSLLLSNQSCKSISIYILDIGISESNKEKLRKTCARYQREMIMVDCKDIENDLRRKGIPQYRNSYATYLKLYALGKLPGNMERLLYIDCDTLIIGSLEPLFETGLGDYPLGMVPDVLAYQYKRKLGFGKTENYYNAGIILIQLKNWEGQGWNRKIDKFLQNNRTNFLGKHDQDIINLVFRKNIVEIPARYNIQSIFCAADLDAVYAIYGDVLTIPKQQLSIEKENGVILHFLSFNGESPWNAGSSHPFQSAFNEYKSQSLWADLAPVKKHMKISYKIEKFLYRNLPATLFLALFRLVHDFFHLI